jgi:hypothetical protein
MLYLLDADTLIAADHTYYPLNRFPIFWRWLRYNGSIDNVKVPVEQFEEIIAGKGDLVDWLKAKDNKDALLFSEDADPALVARVTREGYAPDLNEAELVAVGQDPFIISYCLAEPATRTVVSFEVSAPSKQRANRKVPDVCKDFSVNCVNLFTLIKTLDFTTNWKEP